MVERYYIHVFGGPEGERENEVETLYEVLKRYWLRCV